MGDFRRPTYLSAPRLSGLRLQTLLATLRDPGCRAVLARFLKDPWQVQGSAEYYACDLDLPSELVDVPRYLVELRHGGWLHQRPAAYGLVSRLRRDDLDLRFPDTMRSLRLRPARTAGARGSQLGRTEALLHQLSARVR